MSNIITFLIINLCYGQSDWSVGSQLSNQFVDSTYLKAYFIPYSTAIVSCFLLCGEKTTYNLSASFAYLLVRHSFY